MNLSSGAEFAVSASGTVDAGHGGQRLVDLVKSGSCKSSTKLPSSGAVGRTRAIWKYSVELGKTRKNERKTVKTPQKYLVVGCHK